MENSIQQNNNEREISIWELFSLIFKNWITVTIITVVFLALGIIFAFLIEKQNVTTYSFEEKVIYGDFSYYPTKWLNSYSDLLNTYLNENFDSSNIDEISLIEDKSQIDVIEYTLSVKYAYDISQIDAQAITQEISNWHNKSLNEEFSKIIDEKTLEVDNVSKEYESKQKEYFNFLNKQDGYYDMQSDAKMYRNLITSYEQQLISLEVTLLKVQDGIPLTSEEMSRGDYSVDGLQKQIQFCNTEIDKNQQLLDQVGSTLGQMTADNGIYISEIEVILETLNTKKMELSELTDAYSKIENYYVGNFSLNSSTKSTWKSDIIISLIIGIVFSILFIILKESYLDYRREKYLEQ